VRQNQEFQARIDQLQDKIRSREADVVDLAVQMRSAETILQQALDQTSSCVAAIKQSQQSHGLVSVHDIINYASKVAYTSGKIPGNDPQEPFPSAELFAYTRLFKELIQRKEEGTSMEGVIESEVAYESFLGDLGTTETHDEEELADF
jgi:hypothetical protein